MNVPLARRQLLTSRGRTAAAVAGIGVALLLVIALRAIFAGMEQRLTAFIDRSGADVIVAQRGVDTMHMTQSTLTRRDLERVRATPGVRTATPILYVSTLLEHDGSSSVVYLIGDPRRRLPGDGIVVDSSLGSREGDRVRALGHAFRVVSREGGTASIASSLAYVQYDRLARIMRRQSLPSYMLVRARPGVDAAALAARVTGRVPTVTASTRGAFARSERRVVSDMSTAIVQAMTLVAFAVGVGVAGLVAYTVTLSQLREIATLRAVGLRGRAAIWLVVREVAALVAGGLAVALALVAGLAWLLPRLSATLVLSVQLGDVATTVGVAAAVATAAAAYPTLRVARISPASAFRR